MPKEVTSLSELIFMRWNPAKYIAELGPLSSKGFQEMPAAGAYVIKESDISMPRSPTLLHRFWTSLCHPDLCHTECALRHTECERYYSIVHYHFCHPTIPGSSRDATTHLLFHYARRDVHQTFPKITLWTIINNSSTKSAMRGAPYLQSVLKVLC